MNRLKSCDQASLEAYIRGELDETGCEAVERHVLECEACRTTLEAAFAPEVDRVRRAAEFVAVPTALARRLPPPSRRRWTWSRAALALAGAALAFALWFVFWPLSIPIREVGGIVYRNGEPVRSGDSLRAGDSIVLAEGGSLLSSLVELRPGARWSILTVTRDGWSRTFNFEERGGTSLFRSNRSTSYRATLGDLSVSPFGTTFGLEFASTQPPAVSTYEGAVEIKDGKALMWGYPGQRFVGPAKGPLSDVPTYRRLTSLDLPWDESARFEATPPSEDLKSALRGLSRKPRLPQSWVRLSQVLASEEDWGGVAQALEGLHAIDPEFSSLPEETKVEFLWGLFASEQGSRVALELARRLAGAGAIGVETLEALETWLIKDDTGFPRERTKALEWLVVGKDVEPFARTMVAFWLGKRLQNDPDRLETAIRQFTSLLQTARSGRTRAKIQYARGEARFFIYEHRAESLRDQREAAKSWPRADWLVNVGVRIAEIEGPRQECLSLITEGLKRDPSYANFERALAYFEMSAKSKAEHEEAIMFALMVNSMFRLVPQAHVRFVDLQAPKDADGIRSVFDEAVRLFGVPVDQVPNNARVTHANLIRYERGLDHNWTEDEAKEVGEQTGLTAKGLEYNLAEFYENVGHARLALPILRRADWRRTEVQVLAGRIHQELGEYEKAAAIFRGVLKRPTHQLEPFDRAEAWIRLAESLASIQPAESKEIARGLLKAKIQGLDDGWRKFRKFKSRYDARAHALLGDFKEAVRLQEEYLEAWPWNPDIEREKRRLNEWRLLGTATPKAPSP